MSWGLDITYGVMWYQTGQGSLPGEGKLCNKNHKEGNEKPLHFIFPYAYWASGVMLGREWCKAFLVVIQ